MFTASFRQSTVWIPGTVGFSCTLYLPVRFRKYKDQSIRNWNIAGYLVSMLSLVSHIEQHRLRVFENMAMRKMFGRKRDDIAGDWRWRHNEEFYDTFLSKYSGYQEGWDWWVLCQVRETEDVGQRSDTPRFRMKFDVAFLYSGGQLCAGVRLLEGFVAWVFVAGGLFPWQGGETFNNGPSVVEQQRVKSYGTQERHLSPSIFLEMDLCSRRVCRILYPKVGQIKAGG
jgi:hypothetical protein